MPLNYTLLNDKCSLWVLTTGKKGRKGNFTHTHPQKILIYISKKQELWQQSPNLIETSQFGVTWSPGLRISVGEDGAGECLTDP